MERRTEVTRQDQLKNKVNWESEGNLYLKRCMACAKENWAVAVAAGYCAMCGWNDKNKY